MLQPKIDLVRLAQTLSYEEMEVASQVIGRNDCIRSTKPNGGKAAYVWRMTVFIVSKDGKHQCMPVCADFGVYDEVPEYKAMDMHQRSLYLKGLDRIVDAIVEQVPLSQRAGVIRWGKALGQL